MANPTSRVGNAEMDHDPFGLNTELSTSQPNIGSSNIQRIPANKQVPHPWTTPPQTDNSDMWRSIQEIQSSNRFILQRLQQTLIGLNTCICPCHSTERETELENFRERLKHFDEREKKKDEEIIELKKNLRTLKEKLDKIQTPETFQSMPNAISHGNILPQRQQVYFKEYAYHDSVDQNGTGIKVDRLDQQPLEHVAKDGYETVEEDSQIKLDGDVREACRTFSKVNDKTKTGSTRQTLSEKKENIQGSKRSNVVGEGANDLNRGQSKLKTSFVKSENPNIRRRYIGDAQGKQTFGSTTIGKPSKVNFVKKPPAETLGGKTAETLGVNVIEQREKRTINFMDWHMVASREKMEAQMSGLASLEGIYTVVCVDISYSMTQHNAWKQTKTFFTDLVEGFKESLYRYDIKAESVALVTFGHRTEVLKRLTQDFTSLQNCFEGVSLGGPSPMYGGLLLSMAAFESTVRLGSIDANGITVLPRLVLITDGHLTDTNLLAGPDELTLSERDESNANVLELMQKMERNFDVVCVPVGNADKDFLQLMATVSNGKVLTHKDGRKVGTRLHKVLEAGRIRKAGLPFAGSLYPTDSDEEYIAEILETDEKRKLDRRSLQLLEIPTRKLPEIGSRVRRGPDWKYRGQDSDGPGTVIGHALNDEKIWVEWDNNAETNIYRYGCKGCYDVLVFDEPRMPKPNGDLAVGCIVKPGKDWHELPGTSTGVVIQVDSSEIVKVRWNNGERGDYVHKPGGIQQVEFSPPEEMGKPGANISTSSYAGMQSHSSQSHGDSEYLTQVPKTKRNKNKNKNLVNKNAAKQK